MIEVSPETQYYNISDNAIVLEMTGIQKLSMLVLNLNLEDCKNVTLVRIFQADLKYK